MRCTLALPCLVSVFAVAPVGAATDNPCTNGSFERLAPNGFPADWSPVGTTVEVSSDARTGKHSLRLLRSAGTKSSETGLNRGYRQGDGKQGRMLAELKGGIDFRYKAVSAESAQLNVYVIPMTDEPVEAAGSRRATFTVPPHHVGDGQWHHARLAYDFTDDPKVKWVHFAARIVGAAGELLLDDLSYVERVGPILRFGKIRLEEDPKKPGERGTLVARVENAGDEPVPAVRAKIVLPAGLSADAAEQALGGIPPDEDRQVRWIIDGIRDKKARLELSAVSGDVRTTASYPIAPKLVLRSFGPASPVVLEGGKIVMECVLANPGSAFVLKPRVEFLWIGMRSIPTPAKRSCTVERIAPHGSVVLRVEIPSGGPKFYFRPAVRIRAENASLKRGKRTDGSEVLPIPGRTRGECFVVPDVQIPPPSGRLLAVAKDDYAVLENERLRLVFRRHGIDPFDRDFGFGPGELSVRTAKGWQTVAWLRLLLRRVVQVSEFDPAIEIDAVWRPTAEKGPPARLRFEIAPRSSVFVDRTRMTMSFSLVPGEKTISVRYELTPEKPYGLSTLHGPMLYVLDRDEAIFPGLEWLVGDEVSSGTLDIAKGHPHQLRYVVHPNMVTIPAIGIHGRHGTVGLLWDVHQKWDGTRDRPSVVFASPDRFNNQRSHLMGLFLPTVPEFVEPNERLAKRPYPLKPGKPLVLECRIFADGEAKDALAAVDEWIRWKGLPEPAPLPHGSYDREIEFSMQAYLKSLWEPELQEWWTTKGGGMMSKTGRPRAFVRDLLIGEVLSPGEDVRKACRARAEEVLGLIGGGDAQLGLVRYGGRADLAMANPLHAASLLASRDEQGAWRFDADQRHTTGPFVGRDYHELGPDNAVELGTCAQKAFQVLRYARIAGDWEAYRRMEKTLELMETFRVPRAAQVWEVPVHTPDLLAAADAMDAYLEAYRFSGDERWLRDAVVWARRGLPFIYLWDDPEKPFLVGGSIPVFGATWYRGSWFGRPVQWNGLRYANALLKLAKCDRSQDWRKLAEAIIRSGIHQQDLDGENVALWPDNISAIDSKKCGWVFAPRQILRNVLKLTGRDEDPTTVILGQGEKRLHVTAVGRLSDAVWRRNSLSFRVTYPKGERGVVLVANVAKPATVMLAGKKLGERADIEKGPEPGWRYDDANAFLTIRVDRDGLSAVGVEGAAFRAVHRLPWPVDRIDFQFGDSTEGWAPAHDVASLECRGRALVGQIAGADPYITRGLLNVAGDDCPAIELKMRVTAGRGAQFFWTTKTSPGWSETKSVRFAIEADGRFHTCRLEPGRHPQWAGQTITALRIDPTGGVREAEFAIDYVRAAKE